MIAEPPSDIYLSYNQADYAAIILIASALRKRGLKVLTDQIYHEVDKPWYPTMEQHIANLKSIAICIGSSGIGKWQQRESQLALDRQLHDPDFLVIPVLLPGAENPSLGFLMLNTWIDLRQGLDDDAFDTLTRSIRKESLREAKNILQLYSCFISYSSKDGKFVDKLHNNLQDNYVKHWFAPHDMKIGAKILDSVSSAVRSHDKVLLVLSKNSIASRWVEDEINVAFDEERSRNKEVLFPIRIDNSVFHAEKEWVKKLTVNRNIEDLTKWRNDNEYKKSFQNLLRDIRIER